MLEFLASDLISKILGNICLIFMTIAFGLAIIISLYFAIKGFIDEIRK